MTLRSGGFFQQSRKKVASPPFTLPVRDIPKNDKGISKGNIGVFELEASLDQSEGGIGQRRILTVRLRGNGNIRSISAPVIPSSAEWDVRKVEAEEREESETSHRGMEGSASFVYMVTPKKSGNMAIGPVEWTGFDPRRERFYTLASSALSLTVTATEGEGGIASSGAVEKLPLKPMASTLDPPPTEVGFALFTRLCACCRLAPHHSPDGARIRLRKSGDPITTQKR